MFYIIPPHLEEHVYTWRWLNKQIKQIYIIDLNYYTISLPFSAITHTHMPTLAGFVLESAIEPAAPKGPHPLSNSRPRRWIDRLLV